MPKGGAPDQTETVIYESSNGDCWYLARDAHPERTVVRHQPNRASGGAISYYEINDFLAEGPSPQQEALRRLLSAMAEHPRDSEN
jgi:hypothetical protein